jgi:hypothetical protein
MCRSMTLWSIDGTPRSADCARRTGKGEVEQKDAERLRVDAEERALARWFEDDLVPFTFEALAQRVGDLRFICDDEDPHTCLQQS